MKSPPIDKSFHYTNEQMVKDLVVLLPIQKIDSVLDAGSGKNKVWYNNVNVKEKYECEIEDGCDFMLWDKKIDWVIGNPPYHTIETFMLKASQVAQRGIGFLVRNAALNNLFTPRRLQIIKDNGFELQRIHVVADKRWYGRYYFLIFEKKKGFLSWERKTY